MQITCIHTHGKHSPVKMGSAALAKKKMGGGGRAIRPEEKFGWIPGKVGGRVVQDQKKWGAGGEPFAQKKKKALLDCFYKNKPGRVNCGGDIQFWLALKMRENFCLVYW